MTEPALRAEDVRERYLRANAAYHAGDHLLAIDQFRDVVRLDPDMTKARAKLAGLLRVRGKHLARAGDAEEALAALREAWGWYPSTPKLQRTLREVLHGHVGFALATGDFDHARALLAETGTVDPHDAETARLLALLDVLPRAPFAPWTDDQTAGALDLVVLERGVDEVAVGAYLRLAGRHEAFADRALAKGDIALRSGPVRPLLGLGSVGLPEEVALAAQANLLGAELMSGLRRLVPESARFVEGVDALERLSFEADTLVFSVTKTVFYLSRLLRSGRYCRVVFVLGDGRLSRTLGRAAQDAVGPSNVHGVWCSKTLRRYDRQGRLLDPNDVAAAVAAGAAAPPEGPGPPPAALVSVGDWRRWRVVRVVARRSRGLRRRLRGTRPRRQRRLPLGAVLLLPSPSPLHTALVRPVTAELSRSGPVCVVDIASKRRQRAQYQPYEQLAIEQPGIWVERGLAPVAHRPEIDEVLREALDEAVEQVASDDALRGLQVEGVALWPMLEPALKTFLRRRLPPARRFAQDFARFIDAKQPRAVVLGRDRQGIVRIAIALCRQRGIPTVTTQPYLVSSHPMWNPLQADYVTVVDDFARSVFVDHLGAEPEQVIMTGIPRFDSILGRREDAARHNRPASGRRTVLLILQRFSTDYTRRLITAVASTMSSLDDTHLVVKTHPSESADSVARYRALLADVGAGGTASVVDTGLHDLMVGADVVVAVWSTAILEAAMLDRLVLRVNLSGEPMPVPFVEMGVAVGVDSDAELETALRRSLDDPDFIEEAAGRRHDYLDRNPHLLRRPAAEQIADAVRCLAQGRAPRAP